MTSNHHDPKQRDYADRDIQLKPLVLFAVGTAVFTALVFAAVRYTMYYWETQSRAADAREPALSADRQIATTSLLQVDEPRDLVAQRAWESGMLTNYTLVDASNGVVRIPVERAMEIIARRGLPARTSAP